MENIDSPLFARLLPRALVLFRRRLGRHPLHGGDQLRQNQTANVPAPGGQAA